MEPLHLPPLGQSTANGGGGSSSGGGSRISDIGRFSGSSDPPPADSAIKSFTPSYHLSTKNILVPPSVTPPIPRSSVVIPSSNLPRSSPTIPLPPRGSKSSGDNSPSTGPLFSPTQTSALHGPIPSAPVPSTDRPAVIRTYGKTGPVVSPAGATSAMSGRQRAANVLSSSPKAPSSDEIQEEIEERSARFHGNAVGSARVEVVITPRPPSLVAGSASRKGRTHSPDPLDTLESLDSDREIESLKIFNLPSDVSVVPPAIGASRTTPSSKTDTNTNTQASHVEESGRRVSARVQLHKEEEERKKIERRKKRAEEKARIQLEEQRKAARTANAEGSKGRGAETGKVETREERSARRSEAAGTVPPEEDQRKDRKRKSAPAELEEGKEREVIEFDDENGAIPMSKPLKGVSQKVAAVHESKGREKAKAKAKAKVNDRGKKRKVVQDLEHEGEDGGGDGPVAKVTSEIAEPKAGEATPEISPEKGKGKKRSRVVESSDEEGPVVPRMKSGKSSRDEAAKATTGTSPKKGTADVPADEEEEEAEKEVAEPELRPSKVPSPLGDLASSRSREPLRPIPPRLNAPAVASPSERASPGPQNTPGGIKWKTSRSDLSSVLAKFPGAKYAGMSRRHRIPSLHTKIGPGVKALPPPPPKPVRKKKGDSDDEDDEEEEEEESDGEGGVRMVKKGGKKERGIEWFMQED